MLPEWVEFSTSRDGKTFTEPRRVRHEVDPKDYTRQIHEFEMPLNTDARYVKVLAHGFGTLPAWHAGAGGESHIFVDEVTIR